MKKKLLLLIVLGLCLQLVWCLPAHSQVEKLAKVKELNFVFLHGAGGNVCSLQLLSDTIREQIPAYISQYELDNPDTDVRVNFLLRCYPNDVDIETWADNIAESVNTYLPGKQNLIFIGHSMGGKAALYTVANDIGGLADRTAMVVTINSPVRSLQQYYFTGGTSLADYYQLVGLVSDRGVVESIVNYDSAADGQWVAANKRWLAFISAEATPLSPQFDVGGFDPLPRNMDDSIIPISAQYTSRADAFYYGQHNHNDFANLDEVAASVSEQILRYIFGGDVYCSVLIRGGVLEHAAGWLPGTERWEDRVGEVLVSSGSLSHHNDSFFRWQSWEDVVGEWPVGSVRSSYRVALTSHFPFINSIEEAEWLVPDDDAGCQLYLKTSAAPGSSVQVDWEIYRRGLLPEGVERDHYEVGIATGTPLTTIRRVSWVSSDPGDLRLQIDSEAERPFRWFKAEWRVYYREARYRHVIDEMAQQAWFEPEITAVSSCCN